MMSSLLVKSERINNIKLYLFLIGDDSFSGYLWSLNVESAYQELTELY